MSRSREDCFQILCRVLEDEFNIIFEQLTPDLTLAVLEIADGDYHHLYERMA